MHGKKLRLAIVRLPKNLRANRWWIFCGGDVYFARKNAGLALQSMARSLGNPRVPNDAKVYLKWTIAWRPWADFNLTEAGIFLDGLGQFGNMTRRLASALCVAETMGIREVVVPKESIFRGEIFSLSNHSLSSTLTLRFGTTGKANSRHVKALWVEDFLRNRHVVEAASHSTHNAWSHLRKCLALKDELPDLLPDHLVIHIRGGDVFQNRRPAGYGQPPLGFYEAILDRKTWSHVTIIREDELNPVLEPLVKACLKRSIPVTEQSQTLKEDLEFLLSASSIVAGRGTFIPAVVGLSKRIKEVFYCEDKFVVAPGVDGVNVLRGIDIHGQYRDKILSRNWRDTPDQREMMISYAASNWNFVQQE